MDMIDLPDALAAPLLRQLLLRSESRRLEFKRVSGKMVGKALETVCAFANTHGGTLVLGIADLKEFQGTVRLFGVQENPEAVDELQRKLLTEFQPAIDGLQLQRIATSLHNGPAKGQAGSVLLLQVPRSPRVHSIVNGGTYARLDAGNRSSVLAKSRPCRTSVASAAPAASLSRCRWLGCRRQSGSASRPSAAP